MIAKVLSSIGGVGVFGVISLCLFIVVFTTALLWAVRLKKPYLQVMGQLPLGEESIVHSESNNPLIRELNVAHRCTCDIPK